MTGFKLAVKETRPKNWVSPGSPGKSISNRNKQTNKQTKTQKQTKKPGSRLHTPVLVPECQEME